MRCQLVLLPEVLLLLQVFRRPISAGVTLPRPPAASQVATSAPGTLPATEGVVPAAAKTAQPSAPDAEAIGVEPTSNKRAATHTATHPPTEESHSSDLGQLSDLLTPVVAEASPRVEEPVQDFSPDHEEIEKDGLDQL